MLKLTSIIFPSYHYHIKPTSATQHSTVISLPKEGYSVCQIESKTGLGRSTVGRIRKKMDLDKENSKGGHSSKLSSHDTQYQITTGKLYNAVQAAHFINDILPSPVTTTPTVKHGGRNNLMVWVCMGWNGVGKLTEVEGKMDAVQYCEILEDGVAETFEKLEMEEEERIFQQDNDPKHTSKKATK